MWSRLLRGLLQYHQASLYLPHRHRNHRPKDRPLRLVILEWMIVLDYKSVFRKSIFSIYKSHTSNRSMILMKFPL